MQDEKVRGVFEFGKQQEGLQLIKWDCGSPLYDSYEIASLFNLIERRTMIFPSNSSSSTILLQSPSSSISSASSSTVRFSSATTTGVASSSSTTLSSWHWHRRFKPRESSTRNKEVNEEQEGSIIGTTTGWRTGILSRKRKAGWEDEEIIPPHFKAKKKVKTNSGCFGFFR